MKIKLVMPRQLVALLILIISNSHVSHIILVIFASRTIGLFWLHPILSIVWCE
jgi:hypothetical protein